jgi:hypothetical protein
MKTVDRDFEQLAIRQRPAVPYLLEANARLKKENLGLGRLIGEPPDGTK